MTDPAHATNEPAPARQHDRQDDRRRNWLRIALALSLALNLGVGGMVAGAMLRVGVPGRAECDAGLGPIADALTGSDRRKLREALVVRYRELGAGRLALRADYDVLLQSLRTEPFDPAVVDTALAALATRNADRLSGARMILADYINGLTPEARAALADRLEKILLKKTRPGKARGAEPAAGGARLP